MLSEPLRFLCRRAPLALPAQTVRGSAHIRKQARTNPSLWRSFWRRAGDSNPRYPFGVYSLSRRAPSASRSALRKGVGCIIALRLHKSKECRWSRLRQIHNVCSGLLPIFRYSMRPLAFRLPPFAAMTCGFAIIPHQRNGLCAPFRARFLLACSFLSLQWSSRFLPWRAWLPARPMRKATPARASK